jgi:hypothetical protein
MLVGEQKSIFPRPALTPDPFPERKIANWKLQNANCKLNKHNHLRDLSLYRVCRVFNRKLITDN